MLLWKELWENKKNEKYKNKKTSSVNKTTLKNFLIFSRKTFVLCFRKWNFLALRWKTLLTLTPPPPPPLPPPPSQEKRKQKEKNSYIFSKKGFSFISSSHILRLDFSNLNNKKVYEGTFRAQKIKQKIALKNFLYFGK